MVVFRVPSRVLQRSPLNSLFLAVVCLAGAMVAPLAGATPESPVAVELFAAVDDGALQVRYLPRNERSAHVQIRNVSSRPLTVRLPSVMTAHSARS